MGKVGTQEIKIEIQNIKLEARETNKHEWD